jgi:hypothetical protein
MDEGTGGGGMATLTRSQCKQLSYLIELAHQERGITRRGVIREGPTPRFKLHVDCYTCEIVKSFLYAQDAIRFIIGNHTNHRTFTTSEPRDREDPTKTELRLATDFSKIRARLRKRHKTIRELAEETGLKVSTLRRRLSTMPDVLEVGKRERESVYGLDPSKSPANVKVSSNAGTKRRFKDIHEIPFGVQADRQPDGTYLEW